MSDQAKGRILWHDKEFDGTSEVSPYTFGAEDCFAWLSKYKYMFDNKSDFKYEWIGMNCRSILLA